MRKAKYPCRQTGCGQLIDQPGFCEPHRKQRHKEQKLKASIDYVERNRFYQRKEWKSARAIQLGLEPLCRACKAAGLLTEAVVVDHIHEIANGGDLFEESNLQSLCKPCHERKAKGRAGKNSER